MIYSLTWLPEVLDAAGLKYAEMDGWRSRGRGPMGTVRGVICHHTATRAPGNMPSLTLLRDGRDDLAGPLAQLGLGRDGTYYIVAAGRANHAGSGYWEGLTTGNSSFIGIEAENNGIDEPWPDVQIEAYQRGVAAILAKIGASANMCAGHREYAPKRKTDPDFDMNAFRRGVAEFLQGKSPRPPIASADQAGRQTLRRGASGPDVTRIQTLIKQAAAGNAIDADGKFGPGTEAAVRAFQRSQGLVPDGIVGPASWKVLEPQGPPPPSAGAAPAADPAALAGARAVAEAPSPTAVVAIALPVADTHDHPARSDETFAYTPDGRHFAARWRLGFNQRGTTTIAKWLESLAELPPGVSASTVRVLKAMSINEGLFEAINSYDSAFMSVGILQWTAGAIDGPGELGYLLSILKQDDGATFDDCFGRYGLDVTAVGYTGLLSIGGKVLETSADKVVLRDVAWAYRFWRAAHAPVVQLAQFKVAAGRIARFRGDDVAGHPVSAWFSSERGTAHLLDEHVNRPGHVPDTLRQAVANVYGAAVPDPGALDDAAEADLIKAYLETRAVPAVGAMTDSEARAARIDESVANGSLSSARNSYQP